MYILQYPKDQIVEPGTQKFFWKTAKNLIDDEFVAKMQAFEVVGPKSGEFTKYQTINFIEKNIEGIEQAQVDEFNWTLGRLFRWLREAIDNRKADIIRRKANL